MFPKVIKLRLEQLWLRLPHVQAALFRDDAVHMLSADFVAGCQIVRYDAAIVSVAKQSHITHNLLV